LQVQVLVPGPVLAQLAFGSQPPPVPLQTLMGTQVWPLPEYPVLHVHELAPGPVLAHAA